MIFEHMAWVPGPGPLFAGALALVRGGEVSVLGPPARAVELERWGVPTRVVRAEPKDFLRSFHGLAVCQPDPELLALCRGPVLVNVGRPLISLEHLLCPVDRTVHAARLALRIAAGEGHSVRFLHIHSPVESQDHETTLQQMRRRVAELLEPAWESKVELHFEVGMAEDRADAIAAVAGGVDLVVMGTGSGGLVSRLFGGRPLSEEVLERSPVPVLLVPPR